MKRIGPLRNMLHGLALLYILILPFSSPARVLEGWGLLFGGIIPATAPLVFIVMMFDVMMCQIMKGDADQTRSSELNFTIKLHLLLGFTLLALWLYSFRSVLLF